MKNNYVYYWLNGTMDQVKAENEKEGFARLDFGAGASGACDFWEQEDTPSYEWNVSIREWVKINRDSTIDVSHINVKDPASQIEFMEHNHMVLHREDDVPRYIVFWLENEFDDIGRVTFKIYKIISNKMDATANPSECELHMIVGVHEGGTIINNFYGDKHIITNKDHYDVISNIINNLQNVVLSVVGSSISNKFKHTMSSDIMAANWVQSLNQVKDSIFELGNKINNSDMSSDDINKRRIADMRAMIDLYEFYIENM